jgi:hypothetical protein
MLIFAAIKNRKTNKVEVEKIKGFLPVAWFLNNGQSVWAKVDGNWVDLSGYFIKIDEVNLIKITPELLKYLLRTQI